MKRILAIAIAFALTLLVTTAFAGWEQDSTGWWYKHSDGSYPASAWEKIDGSWYWFNGNGYMVTGLQTIQGVQYYFANSGAMQIGWLQLGDSWYHFSDSGAMTKDAWIGEYYLGADGVMLTDTTTPDGVRVGKTGNALPATGVTITVTQGETTTTVTIPQNDLATTVTITSDGVTSTVTTSTGPRNDEHDGPYGVVTPSINGNYSLYSHTTTNTTTAPSPIRIISSSKLWSEPCGSVITTLPRYTIVYYMGETVEAAGYTWYKVEYNGVRGYIIHSRL